MIRNRIDNDSKIDLIRCTFGNRSGAMLEVLRGLKERVSKPVVINLPRFFDSEQTPNDLDIVLPGGTYATADEFLRAAGFTRLSGSPDPSQGVYIRAVEGGGFARVHLHADFGHWGLLLTSYEKMAGLCDQFETCLLPKRALDYWILTAEWFFRKKLHYPDRIEQVSSGVDNTELQRAATILFLDHLPLIRRIDHIRREGCKPTDRLQVGILLREVGLHGALLRTIVSKAWQRRPLQGLLRRQGKLIFLMGVDGAGKTSAAEGVVKDHQVGGLVCRSEYLGLKQTVVQRIKSNGSSPGQQEPQSKVPRGLVDRLENRSKLLANLVNFGLSIAYVLDYAIRIQRVRRFLGEPDRVALVDRNYYDRLADPRRPGDSLLYYLLPRPDLVVALTGCSGALSERKPEYTPTALRQMQTGLTTALVWLKTRGTPVVVIDTVKNDKETVRRRIAACLLAQLEDLSAADIASLDTSERPDPAARPFEITENTAKGDKP